MWKILSSIAALLSPQACTLCGRDTLPGEGPVCPECLSALPRFHDFGNRYPLHLDRLFRKEILFSYNALFVYDRDNNVARLIRQFKYYNSPRLASQLGHCLADAFARSPQALRIDCVIPVPVHTSRLLKRGYNQSRLLARPVAEALDVPLLECLSAPKPHLTQTHKDIEERKTGVNDDTFSVTDPEPLSGQHILLVDDVITTGSTITAAASTLSRLSVNSTISALALAATQE